LTASRTRWLKSSAFAGSSNLARRNVHCVVPGGGLSPDRRRWIPCGHKFFLPVKVLSVVFRGKFLSALQRAFQKHQLTLAGQLAPLQSPAAFAALLRTAAQPNWSSTLIDPLPAPSASLDLPCALYPPHCHRQLPTRFDDRWQSQLPVARLRPWASDSHYDSRCP